MTDEQTPAFEAGDDVVQPEAFEPEAEAPEEVDSTEGQVETQPADDDAKADADAEAEDQKSRSQRRREQRKAEMESLRAAEAEANKRAEDARKRLEEVQNAAKSLPKPKSSDFADFEEYQAALSAYHSVGVLDRREAARLEQDAKASYEAVKAAKQAQQQKDQESWAEQLEEARARYKDFDQVALNEKVRIDRRMAEQIMQSDVAADVAYYIGKNPELADRLATLPDVRLAREIGRIEATVSAPKPKSVSTAPEPITPIRGKATAVVNPEKMGIAEYIAARKAGKIT